MLGEISAKPAQCLCSRCLRPVVVYIPAEQEYGYAENACPACHSDVCGCDRCLTRLRALRAGCRDWTVLGIRRPIVSWSEAEGIELVPPNTTFH